MKKIAQKLIWQKIGTHHPAHNLGLVHSETLKRTFSHLWTQTEAFLMPVHHISRLIGALHGGERSKGQDLFKLSYNKKTYCSKIHFVAKKISDFQRYLVTIF